MNTTQRAIKSIRNYLENDLGLETYESFVIANELKIYYLKEMSNTAFSQVDEDDTDPIGSEEESDGEEELEDAILNLEPPQEMKGGKVKEKETPEGPEDFLEDKNDENDDDPLDDDDWDDDEDEEEEKPKKKKK